MMKKFLLKKIRAYAFRKAQERFRKSYFTAPSDLVPKNEEIEYAESVLTASLDENVYSVCIDLSNVESVAETPSADPSEEENEGEDGFSMSLSPRIDSRGNLVSGDERVASWMRLVGPCQPGARERREREVEATALYRKPCGDSQWVKQGRVTGRPAWR
eukprot:Rmarinus@m.26485